MPKAARGEEEKPVRGQTRRGAETRARLVQAAKEIFERDGFLEARITDIAQRAGVSHGSYYHYFDSKEQLFREVAELWLVQGYREYEFEHAVEQLSRLWSNALGLPDEPPPRRRARRTS